MKRPGGFRPEDSAALRPESDASVPSESESAASFVSQRLIRFTRKANTTAAEQTDSTAPIHPDAVQPEKNGTTAVDDADRYAGYSAASLTRDPDVQLTVPLDDTVSQLKTPEVSAEVVSFPNVELLNEVPDPLAQSTDRNLKLRNFSGLVSLGKFPKSLKRQQQPNDVSVMGTQGDTAEVFAASPQHAYNVELDPVAQAEKDLKKAERARKKSERRQLRRFTSQSRGRRRHWVIAGGSVLLLAVFVLIGVCSPVMAVRDVQIVGAEQVNVEELDVALQRFSGVPLALIGEEELHRALEPFPLIQRYSVERIPPGTLRVNIEERTPVIAITGDTGFRMIDAAGVLTGEFAEIPPGIVLANGGVVDTSSDAFAAAATVVRDLPEDIRMQIAAASASNEQDLEFVLHSGVVTVWGESSDTQRKAVVLRSMLASVPGATRFDVSAPEAPVFQ